jgi:hypothetical protein
MSSVLFPGGYDLFLSEQHCRKDEARQQKTQGAFRQDRQAEAGKRQAAQEHAEDRDLGGSVTDDTPYSRRPAAWNRVKAMSG